MRLTKRVIALAVILASASSAEAARKVRCGGGDVACVIAAIEASNADGRDTVLVLDRGVYTLDPVAYPSLLPDGLTSTGTLTIKGAGADFTVIQRMTDAPPFRIVTATGRLTIEGVSIVGGNANDTSCLCGGGIFSAGVLTIVASRVSMNRTNGAEGAAGVPSRGQGGGIAAMGPLTIIDSFVSLNTSNTGGGISAGAATTIMGSTISANAGFAGGGIAGGALEMSTSAMTGNTAAFGGAIFSPFGADYTLTNTTITGNHGTFGGAIQIGTPDAPIGVCCFHGTTLIANSTVSGNHSIVGPGGIGGPPALAEQNDQLIQLRHTILTQNTTGSVAVLDCGSNALFTSLGHNVIGVCAPLALSDTDLTGDPRLDSLVDDGTPGNAHLPLLSDSPAIDAGGTPHPHHGHEADCPRADQIGDRRVGACDIGAIEFQPSHQHDKH
jgi:hypothetical protein